jgi:Fic family protein
MRAKLYIPNPPVQSSLGRLLISLEPLRNKKLTGTTPPWIFFELKRTFQTIESVTSSRIEGNHTTIADFVEAVREDGGQEDMGEEVKEIENVEKGIAHIEQLQRAGQLKINKDFILQLHHIVVGGLSPSKEGDTRIGAYRNAPRRISKSSHVPPPASDVDDFMKLLIDFIEGTNNPQLDLLKVAVAHHRFVWIHPFGNGNGRVVRLLTYAMLAKAGFIDSKGRRLLDPAAIFGKNRDTYYKMLSDADDCTEAGLVSWCEYLLTGIRNEVGKIDRLLDEDFAKEKIILPALNYTLEKERISSFEHKMLLIAVERDIVKAADFSSLFPEKSSHVNVSLAIRKLKEQRLIMPVDTAGRPNSNGRRYTVRLNRNTLSLGIIKQLDKEGFLPEEHE